MAATAAIAPAARILVMVMATAADTQIATTTAAATGVEAMAETGEAAVTAAEAAEVVHDRGGIAAAETTTAVVGARRRSTRASATVLVVAAAAADAPPGRGVASIRNAGARRSPAAAPQIHMAPPAMRTRLFISLGRRELC